MGLFIKILKIVYKCAVFFVFLVLSISHKKKTARRLGRLALGLFPEVYLTDPFPTVPGSAKNLTFRKGAKERERNFGSTPIYQNLEIN